MLRGRLGEAFGSFGGVLGGFWELLEPLETALGASGVSQGDFWELLEPLEPPLGTSGASQRGFWELLEPPGGRLGCFWDVSGSLFGVYWGSESELGAEKT